MRPLVARLLTAWMIAQAPAAVHALEPDEVDALVARPSIGLYTAYAEFKMARYLRGERGRGLSLGGSRAEGCSLRGAARRAGLASGRSRPAGARGNSRR